MTSKSSKEPVKEISTDAIASFVYGTIQITLTVIVFVLFWYFSSKIGAMFGAGGNTPQTLNSCIADGTNACNSFQSPSTPKPSPSPDAAHMIDYKEVIFIFVSNILSFFGIVTGFSAMREISKLDKIGTNLATLGLFSSFICLGLTVFIAWLVPLPL